MLGWVYAEDKTTQGGIEGKRAQSQLWPDAIWGHASEAKEEHTPVDQQRPNQHQTVPAFLPILP